ncbi:Helix-turn-helix domain-containing protein [Streptoalloteichus hindustanus]|uniref:Helix-turn-helix domain-containing protein n=2 Tax=Streptoalloteichus hindustanus TaxID=2017 RepID=A0A1M5QI84_STRHI|nr:Helix-turn-helix domain-containing protein [Streptoalloteichus hindustanus]
MRCMETFGQALRRLRQQAGLSQAELSRATKWSQSQISRAESGNSVPDESTTRLLDTVLQAGGLLLTLQQHDRRGVLVPPERAERAPDLVLPTDDPWSVSDVARRLHRTDVGPQTLEQLRGTVEDLCCEYPWRDPATLRGEAKVWLEYTAKLLDSRVTLREHRELLVAAGWLTLLIGCLEYDMGLKRPAEISRNAAFQLGRETGHGEIIAWSHELSAWFALTQDRLRSVPSYARAGQQAAPQASVAVQLAAQAAKAHARMGDHDQVQKMLDEGFRLLDKHDHPSRPENHFVIDPTKWDFYAMDCYRLVGEHKKAAEHAHEVIHLAQRPDGTERSPMRALEARLTLAIIALREGDLEAAQSWTEVALSTDRRSVMSLAMLTGEMVSELRHRHDNDPAAAALLDQLLTARRALPPA